MGPGHINIVELSQKQPVAYDAFKQGCFTGQKSIKRFSCTAINQVHEQENAKVKNVGMCSTDLEKQTALCRWMLGGPELNPILEDFESFYDANGTDLGDYHHEKCISSQLSF